MNTLSNISLLFVINYSISLFFNISVFHCSTCSPFLEYTILYELIYNIFCSFISEHSMGGELLYTKTDHIYLVGRSDGKSKKCAEKYNRKKSE